MRLVVVLLILISFSAVSKDNYVHPIEEKLSWVETADVEADFKKSIENRDFRIKCVMGYALECPGVHDRKGLSYSVIENTGDVIYSDRHDKLLKMTREYARVYNIYLADFLKKSHYGK